MPSQVTPCALMQSFVHCFFLFFSMMSFQHGASLLWRCVLFLCKNHYCVMLFLRFILPWYSLYFWLCIQGIHPTIKGEVWEFLLGCYDPKSTTEQRNQLRQQRRFFRYYNFLFNHAVLFMSQKYQFLLQYFILYNQGKTSSYFC